MGRLLHKIAGFCLLAICASLALTAQTNTRQKPAAKATAKAADKTAASATDIDPLALRVLKAVTEPIRNAQNYSFRTRVTRERLGTNGQIITHFTESDVLVSRPDKLNVDFKGRGHHVQLFYNGGKAILYSPEPNLYATVAAPGTIDGVLDALDKREVYLPVKNFLEKDPYAELVPDLKTAYVIGEMTIFGETVHQLAFTEDGAEWQLWVTGGPQPRVRRLQVINKSMPHAPRVTVDFLDWNFDAEAKPEMFRFKQPADAKQVPFMLAPREGKR
jgi:hypothetical protein